MTWFHPFIGKKKWSTTCTHCIITIVNTLEEGFNWKCSEMTQQWKQHQRYSRKEQPEQCESNWPGVVGRVVHVHVHVQVWVRRVVGQSVSRAVRGGLWRSGGSQQGGLVEGSLREDGRRRGEGGVGSGRRQACGQWDKAGWSGDSLGCNRDRSCKVQWQLEEAEKTEEEGEV